MFDHIHVSTDSHEIAEVASQPGFSVDFFRDNSLVDDCTALITVLRWAVDQFQRRGAKVDRFFCIMPKTPLLKSSDLIGGFNIFN